MKKNLLSVLAIACVVVTSQLISCKKDPPLKSEKNCGCEPRYRPNEIIVAYKKKPTEADRDKIRSDKQKYGIDPVSIKIDSCNSCNSYVELWTAPNISSTIQQPAAAGTRTDRGSNGQSEDDLAYYSLNFTQNIPLDTPNFEDEKYDTAKRIDFKTDGRSVIRVAVLDTGIDTDRIIRPKFRWTNAKERSGKAKEDDDGNCYKDDVFGWNFIAETSDVKDGHRNLHGTLVSNYILNEFAGSSDNTVEIMTLKTHDDDGNGDLFSSICAIHYAMDKEANIINASWGFYFYEGRPHLYLDSLITKILRKRGILFVAAAGNKIDEQDLIAQNEHLISSNHLRNLEYHNFYPAILSQDENNNVVTVTTADKNDVSPTQNYSSKYVDVGAIPDQVATMKFQAPLNGPLVYIPGSSFATPIVTGRIGAFLPKSFYAPDINKSEVLNAIEMRPTLAGAPPLITKSNSLQAEKIRAGRLVRHRKIFP